MSKRQGWVVLSHRKRPIPSGLPAVFIPAYSGLYRSRTAAERAAKEWQGWAADDVERITVAEVRES